MADRMSGKTGEVRVGSVGGGTAAIAVTDWDMDEAVTTPDASDSNSGDYENHVIGRKSATFRFAGNVYDDATPLPSIAIGTSIKADLYLNASLIHAVPNATITSLKTTTPIKSGDPVMYEGTAKVQGSWTPAT